MSQVSSGLLLINFILFYLNWSVFSHEENEHIHLLGAFLLLLQTEIHYFLLPFFYARKRYFPIRSQTLHESGW